MVNSWLWVGMFLRHVSIVVITVTRFSPSFSWNQNSVTLLHLKTLNGQNVAGVLPGGCGFGMLIPVWPLK